MFHKLMERLKRYEVALHISYEVDTVDIIKDLLAHEGKKCTLLDLGCGKGNKTLEFANAIDALEVLGVELEHSRALEASKRGIAVVCSDLEYGLPLRSESIDIIVSNQVVEHLLNVDLFVDEIRRVLKPSGYCVVATENLSSWDNIGSLILGWKPFAIDSSETYNIGNPLAPGYMKKGTPRHIRAFTWRSFRELFEVNGMHVVKMAGTGYPPFHGRINHLLSKLDGRHARFIVVVAHAIWEEDGN